MSQQSTLSEYFTHAFAGYMSKQPESDPVLTSLNRHIREQAEEEARDDYLFGLTWEEILDKSGTDLDEILGEINGIDYPAFVSAIMTGNADLVNQYLGHIKNATKALDKALSLCWKKHCEELAADREEARERRADGFREERLLASPR
jgi:hypothetical protein